jgi:hypothetical protein
MRAKLCLGSKREVDGQWRGVGGEAEDGLDLGLEEGLSATCRRGRDPDGSTASADGGAISTILGSTILGPTRCFHGGFTGLNSSNRVI